MTSLDPIMEPGACRRGGSPSNGLHQTLLVLLHIQDKTNAQTATNVGSCQKHVNMGKHREGGQWQYRVQSIFRLDSETAPQVTCVTCDTVPEEHVVRACPAHVPQSTVALLLEEGSFMSQ